MVTSALSYLPGFLLADPTFFCQKQGSSELEKCLEDLWCDKYYPNKYTPDMVDWKYDYSWVKQREIICEHGAERAEYKNIIIILSTIVSFVFITLSDSIGRVRSLQISVLFIAAAALAAYFIDNIVIKVIALGF